MIGLSSKLEAEIVQSWDLGFPMWHSKTSWMTFESFIKDVNLLRDGLEITPIDQACQFVSPSSGDAIMDFVNQLGYTKVIHFVSRMAVNNLYQPRREILSMINQCLTSKTSGHDRPRYPTFLTDKANLGSSTKKGRKDKLHVISYCRFTKLIICHLGRIHNIHQRSTSPFHLAEEDLRLGNLKFIPKGEVDEPKRKERRRLRVPSNPSQSLLSGSQANQHLHQSKATKERPFKASTAKPPKPKLAKEKSTKTTPPQKAGKGKISKVRKVKSPFQLVDEPDEEPAQSELEPELKYQGEGDEDDMERAIQMTIEASSTGPSTQAQDDTSANIVHDSPSPADAEIGVASEKNNNEGDTEILQIDKEQGKDVDEQVNPKEKTDELDQGQARSDPGRTPESRPLPEHVVIDEDQAGPDLGERCGALAGPDPKPTHDEFMADLYPNVQESLKFSANEHVILEDPISSTRTLSSMNNLEDVYAIEDQFITNKSTEDEPEKPNVEAEVVSMVTVPIYQASSSVPPLSTPIPIDEAVCESVREFVHVALQAPLRDRLRELPEADMKEILHQRMFETGTYKSLPEHVALYEALKASMERANMDELLTKMDKSRKR
uniref:Uncharacterized protein n=1 Tax=Tanacetum cinerariifolium TaxID=118510 RepID=A0A6L2KH13_TANCI|nr:hypothetical protein [Tanacetum cinerariifolium]